MRVADPGHMEARGGRERKRRVTVKIGDQASVKIDAYRTGGLGHRPTNRQYGKTNRAGTQEEVTN